METFVYFFKILSCCDSQKKSCTLWIFFFFFLEVYLLVFLFCFAACCLSPHGIFSSQVFSSVFFFLQNIPVENWGNLSVFLVVNDYLFGRILSGGCNCSSLVNWGFIKVVITISEVSAHLLPYLRLPCTSHLIIGLSNVLALLPREGNFVSRAVWLVNVILGPWVLNPGRLHWTWDFTE